MIKQIFVIDDEEGIRESFQLALEECRYHVVMAGSGEEGIEKIKKNHPDLIFLDLKMPGMDGIETLRRLHKLCADAPIYILTAFHAEYMSQLQKAMEEGIVFEICHKPIDCHQIKRLVDSVLKKKMIRKMKFPLKLYVAGQTPSAIRAVESIKRIFEEEMGYEYELTVIDIIKEPELAERENILATPTLVVVHEIGSRMIIGDLSDTKTVLSALDVL